MKELYIAYLDSTQDPNQTYMFDVTDLREFVYKQNKNYGMPKVVGKEFVWSQNENNLELKAYYGEKQINIKDLIEG
jgi:hypothetical protein